MVRCESCLYNLGSHPCIYALLQIGWLISRNKELIRGRQRNQRKWTQYKVGIGSLRKQVSTFVGKGVSACLQHCASNLTLAPPSLPLPSPDPQNSCEETRYADEYAKFAMGKGPFSKVTVGASK